MLELMKWFGDIVGILVGWWLFCFMMLIFLLCG